MKLDTFTFFSILIWTNRFVSIGISSAIFTIAIISLALVYKRIKVEKEINFLTVFSLFLILEGAYYRNDFFDILRDGLYWLFPLVIFYVGYNIKVNKESNKIPPILIYLAIIDASIFLFNFLNYSNIQAETLFSLRQEIGKISFFSTFIGALLIGFPKKQLKVLISTSYPLLIGTGILILIGVILSQARFQLFSFLIIALLCRIGKLDFKFILISSLVTIPILISLFLVYSNTEFLAKIFNSLKELNFASAQNLKTQKEINEVWRAYEAYQGIQHYMSYDSLGKIFGEGFGAVAQLDQAITLKNNEYSYLFIWHIAFITIMVKGGIVGLFLYVRFYLNIIYRALIKQKLSLLIGVSILYIFFGFFTSQGWFAPKFYLIILFIGYLSNNKWCEIQT